MCMLGLRYKSYCSNIARTLMVGPTQEMQANYALLLKAQDAAIAALRQGYDKTLYSSTAFFVLEFRTRCSVDINFHLLASGVKLSEVYDAAIKSIQSEKPELVDKSTKNAGSVFNPRVFVGGRFNRYTVVNNITCYAVLMVCCKFITNYINKNCVINFRSFGMGLEFREASMLVSPKSDLVAVKGMVFNLNLGFSDLLNKDAKDDGGKIYSLFIGDTVLVNDEVSEGLILADLMYVSGCFKLITYLANAEHSWNCADSTKETSKTCLYIPEGELMIYLTQLQLI